MMTERHALYVGWVLGIALRNGVPLAPVLDADGNYTDQLDLMPDWEQDERTHIIVVVPEPPRDWVTP
jgi:hypothetical protein